jgi:hypothetical protein
VKWSLNLCPYCGRLWHTVGLCPRVKAVQYDADGAVKRVELYSFAERMDLATELATVISSQVKGRLQMPPTPRQNAEAAQRAHKALTDKGRASRSNALKDAEFHELDRLMGVAVAQSPADPVVPPVPEPSPNENIFKGSDDHGGKTINGGTPKIDVVEYPRPRSYYTFTGSAAQLVVSQSGGGMDTLNNIDMLRFRNANSTWDSVAPAALVSAPPVPGPDPVPPTPNPDPIPVPPPGPVTGDPFIIETSTGVTFNENDGQPLTPWAPPSYGFTTNMRLLRKGSLTVIWRRDSDGRAEIQIENGRCWGTTAPQQLKSFTWTVRQAGKVLATRTGTLGWFSRDIWESAPAPIRKTPGALLPAVQPYALGPYNAIRINLPTLEKYSKPGDLAGLMADMAGTGGRFDIGLNPGGVSWYLATQNSVALAVMRAQADAIGSFPIIIRDENTNRPVSLDQYPNATTFAPNGKPAGTPFITKAADNIGKIDGAHWPEVSGVMFLLTGSIRYLEDLQFGVMANQLAQDPGYRQGKLGIWLLLQVRFKAWMDRGMNRAAAYTPLGNHATLLPGEYFYAFVDNNRKWFDANIVRNTNPQQSRFYDYSDLVNARADTGDFPAAAQTYMKDWQNNMGVQVNEEALDMGFEQLLAQADWALNVPLSRTMPPASGGWKRCYPAPYITLIDKGGVRQPDGKWVFDFYPSLGAAWAAQEAAMKAAGSWKADGSDALAPNQSADFVWRLHAALARAGRRNAQAKANAAWLRTQAFKNGSTNNIDVQHCLAFDA